MNNKLCNTEDKLYTDIVKEHFLHPRNMLTEEGDYTADAVGTAGNSTCGDMMAFWIKVDPKTKNITECKWRTYGCASSISSTSMLSEMILEDGGLTLDKAKKLTQEAIIERLGGLPDKKYKCSTLGYNAMRDAIKDYEENHELVQ